MKPFYFRKLNSNFYCPVNKQLTPFLVAVTMATKPVVGYYKKYILSPASAYQLLEKCLKARMKNQTERIF